MKIIDVDRFVAKGDAIKTHKIIFQNSTTGKEEERLFIGTEDHAIDEASRIRSYHKTKVVLLSPVLKKEGEEYRRYLFDMPTIVAKEEEVWAAQSAGRAMEICAFAREIYRLNSWEWDLVQESDGDGVVTMKIMVTEKGMKKVESYRKRIKSYGKGE